MTNRIDKISIDEKSLIRSEKNRNERERAITDLLDRNIFALQNSDGPFNINVEVADNKFMMSVSNENEFIDKIAISLASMRRIIKDYHVICESYYDAVSTADPRRIEAIDMGRRGVHNEGAELLQDLISEKITTDFETLRKLFSLIYVLQIK